MWESSCFLCSLDFFPANPQRIYEKRKDSERGVACLLYYSLEGAVAFADDAQSFTLSFAF